MCIAVCRISLNEASEVVFIYVSSMLRACHHHPHVELCLRVIQLQVVFSSREMELTCQCRSR